MHSYFIFMVKGKAAFLPLCLVLNIRVSSFRHHMKEIDASDTLKTVSSDVILEDGETFHLDFLRIAV